MKKLRKPLYKDYANPNKKMMHSTWVVHFFLLFFLLFPTLCAAQEEEKREHYLSILAIFRDEAEWFPEWLEYHLLVGVEHFYLINHKSKDHYLEILQPYIDQGIVTLMDYSEVRTQKNHFSYFYILQRKNYERAIQAIGDESYWLAVLDLDEFLVPMQGERVPPLLKEYEEAVGLQINWINFGTGGVEKIGKGKLLIERLLWRAEDHYTDNYVFKSIVRPTKVSRCPSAHFFLYRGRKAPLDTAHIPQPPRASHALAIRNRSVLRDRIVIHHYRVRDLHYLHHTKILRGSQYNRRHLYSRKALEQQDRECSRIKDETMLRFVPELRKRLAATHQATK